MCAFGQIRGSCDLVGHNRHALDYAADSLRTFYRVGDATEQQVGLELDEVSLVGFDVIAKLLRRVLLGEAVRVVAVRQQQHLDIHALGQQHVDASYGGMYAGGVAVVKHGYVGREAAD